MYKCTFIGMFLCMNRYVYEYIYICTYKAGRPVQTYIQKLFADTEYSPEDQAKAMHDREVWREMVRNIRADSAT